MGVAWRGQDTELLIKEQVDRFRFMEGNERLIAAAEAVPWNAVTRPLGVGCAAALLPVPVRPSGILIITWTAREISRNARPGL
jgi:hypothetical protein